MKSIEIDTHKVILSQLAGSMLCQQCRVSLNRFYPVLHSRKDIQGPFFFFKGFPAEFRHCSAARQMYSKISQLFAKFTMFGNFFQNLLKSGKLFQDFRNSSKSFKIFLLKLFKSSDVLLKFLKVSKFLRNSFRNSLFRKLALRSSNQRHHWPRVALFFL